MRRLLPLLVIAAFVSSIATAGAQSVGTTADRSNDYWLKYTGKLPVGSTIRVRTADGHRTTAVLAIVDETGITIQPKTRVPESPRHISFDQLRQVELKEGGAGAGRSAAMGAIAGGATILGTILIFALAGSWD